ncbi:hypothetical protein Kisp01_50230 [Kineosporia sp. NBRC 101677]|uniref:hypothetical protein n=1 Tax=Kineosporia sp. NBRC 101677 TaxID=3032197 RepID=UPI0024A191A9|nr:hypothetical protein [Kineosporia sp. NBRC 101677]GLY18009.1 hypothetical protein Kisp01_50230 [Kineosporia sp. NBRC 101677]
MISVGDAADVFAALGTVGAFGVSLYLLKQEQHREAARSEDERRAQAAQVSAWLEARTAVNGGRNVYFFVRNASDMPIYEVSLPGFGPSGDGLTPEAEFIGLVPPRETVQRPAPKDWLKDYFAPEPVRVEFTDSRGRSWARDERGSLDFL